MESKRETSCAINLIISRLQIARHFKRAVAALNLARIYVKPPSVLLSNTTASKRTYIFDLLRYIN